MRIVSMVPSWTETLVSAGVNVVGRTRFCIHPKEEVRNIPVVGGTKDFDLEKIKALKPDFLLLDQEENPKSMSELLPFVSTHVRHVQDVAVELTKLSQAFQAAQLEALADRWQAVSEASFALNDWEKLPGVIEWWRKPQSDAALPVAYVIWKKPWMLAGAQTFIGSMLEKVGCRMIETSAKYPEVLLEDLPRECVLLFSSEPFPFARAKDECLALGRPAALVDGEAFSWFGLRSLEFLEGLSARANAAAVSKVLTIL